MQKICAHTWCGQNFEVSPEDTEFYEKVSPMFASKKFSLPAPSLCPDCRYRQRLTWRNERKLYRNRCAATGKDLVSIFSSDKSWPPVYDQQYWWSDKWDAKEYGREIDFGRPFFEQWAELFRVTPQLAMNNQMSENCEFTNQSQRNKDCYMIFCSNDSRNCLHGMWLQKCVNCMDCTYLEESELCYEVLNGKNCYRCMFSRNLENCSDMVYSKNCIGCKHCCGCINLRNKEYYFFNEKCSKEDYQKRLLALRLTSNSGVADATSTSEVFFLKFPCKYYTGAQGENFSGDYLINIKNTLHCFNCRNTENFAYCQDVWRAHDCHDLTETIENDFCYSVEGSAISSNTLFSKKFCDLSNSLYCSHCNFSKNLFGCVSVNHGQYCILNKQYTKEAYELLVSKLLEHMQKTGEWGEHFPSRFSPFGYNESVAQEYFPLSEEETGKLGYVWRPEEDDVSAMSKIIPATDLPETVEEIPSDVLDWAIRCAVTARPFKIIRQELDFYRSMNLPLPRLHSDERYRLRMAKRNPRKLWNRTCAKCSEPIATSYSPERPEIVYCEACYMASVY